MTSQIPIINSISTVSDPQPDTVTLQSTQTAGQLLSYPASFVYNPYPNPFLFNDTILGQNAPPPTLK